MFLHNLQAQCHPVFCVGLRIYDDSRTLVGIGHLGSLDADWADDELLVELGQGVRGS